ncbi:lipopolysaccharide biosynthesis protein [Legionella brunensis]|uniref:Polysaccharide biosynthesis protein n=1 Tax=Legionella brunensis TaxID=29422 RepID=A0A0W0S1V7_9GAMM|nr:oligosaccharide flippase family protein [Legionella brunensis]KTC76933.1 Polysaccharide biosynthesis protein [Legionella brunensis]
MDFAFNLLIIIADQLMLFVINMLVARNAGEALFGDFTVATNALFLIATLITLGIDSIIGYYVPKFYVKRHYHDIRTLTVSVKSFIKPIYLTLLVSGLLLSLAIIGLSLALKELELFEIGHPLTLFIWGAVVISLYNIYTQFFRAVDYMRTAVILSLMQTVFYFILSLFTYFYLYPVLFHDDPNYFPHVMLIGFIVSYLLSVLIAVIIQRKTKLQILLNPGKRRREIGGRWKEKMYGYTVQNLNRYVFTAVPLLMIEWLGHSEHVVGLFSAVTSIISLAFIAISPIGILIGPDISAAFTQSREALAKTMKKYIVICLGIAFFIALIIGVFAEKILLLYQSNFIDALPYTYICLFNIFTYAVSMPLYKMIQYSKEGSRVGAQLSIYILLFQIIACLILIPWLNLVGAILCYIGINIVYNAAMIIMAFKIYKRDSFGNGSSLT